MATYINSKNESKAIDLLRYNWSVISKNNWKYGEESATYEECLECNEVALSLDSEVPSAVFDDAYPDFPDSCEWIELHFQYGMKDVMQEYPEAVSLAYPAGSNPLSYCMVTLSDIEKRYFSRLLYNALSDTDRQYTHFTAERNANLHHLHAQTCSTTCTRAPEPETEPETEPVLESVAESAPGPVAESAPEFAAESTAEFQTPLDGFPQQDVPDAEDAAKDSASALTNNEAEKESAGVQNDDSSTSFVVKIGKNIRTVTAYSYLYIIHYPSGIVCAELAETDSPYNFRISDTQKRCLMDCITELVATSTLNSPSGQCSCYKYSLNFDKLRQMYAFAEDTHPLILHQYTIKNMYREDDGLSHIEYQAKECNNSYRYIKPVSAGDGAVYECPIAEQEMDVVTFTKDYHIATLYSLKYGKDEAFEMFMQAFDREKQRLTLECQRLIGCIDNLSQMLSR